MRSINYAEFMEVVTHQWDLILLKMFGVRPGPYVVRETNTHMVEQINKFRLRFNL